TSIHQRGVLRIFPRTWGCRLMRSKEHLRSLAMDRALRWCIVGLRARGGFRPRTTSCELHRIVRNRGPRPNDGISSDQSVTTRQGGGNVRRLVIGVIFAACAIFSPPALGHGKTNIFVATAPTPAVYYPIGGGIADVLTKNIPGLNATAGTTDGSMANLLLIQQGRADIALSMADASWDAFKGQDKFKDRQVQVRALMVLYPNRMHIVTVEGSGINKVADLRGKRGAPAP